MLNPIRKFSEAAHTTQFWHEMYSALTDNINVLKFLKPCVNISRELLGMPPLSTTSTLGMPIQLAQSTLLDPSDFVDIVRKLKEKLDRNVPMVAVIGEAGAGKSRVVASLFEKRFRPKTAQPVWFQGSSEDQLTELARTLTTMAAEYPSKRLCIILDEDHQAGRDIEFFRGFLGNVPLRSLCGNHQVVLTLRSATYEMLNPDAMDSVKVHCGVEALDNFKQWGLNHAVTPAEREWIERIAVDESGHLSPFFMDKICTPSINNGTFAHEDSEDAEDKLRLIYSHLVAKSPSNEELMHAVCIANREGSFAPLWLITAVLHAMGHDCSIGEVRRLLENHKHDGLLRETGVKPEPEIAAWSFSHDLIDECIRDKQSRQQPPRVNFQRIETAAAKLIEKQAGESLEEFEKALEIWVALICQQKDGALAIMQALQKAHHTLAAPVDKPRLLNSLSHLHRYVQYHPTLPHEWKHSGNLDAFLILMEMAKENVSPDQVVTICEGRNVGRESVSALLGLAHSLVAMGNACKRYTPSLCWEDTEATIPSLIKIGEICTQMSTEDAFEKIQGLLPRVRYAQLLMWAGRWSEAGDAIMAAIAEAKGEKECVVLHYLGIVIHCYMKSHNTDKLIPMFETCIEHAKQDATMAHLIDLLNTNIQIVSSWDASRGNMQWADLMGEWQRKILSASKTQRPNFVYVVSALGHASASAVSAILQEEGIKSELIYASALPGLDKLPESSGIVVVDGHLTDDIQRLMTPVVTPEQFAQRKLSEPLPPAYGVTSFDVKGRPGVWIASWYPWDTYKAIENWIETGGANDFVERVKAANNMNVQIV